MIEGDSAEMSTETFPLMSMWSRAEDLSAQTQERGPPSALADFLYLSALGVNLQQNIGMEKVKICKYRMFKRKL